VPRLAFLVIFFAALPARADDRAYADELKRAGHSVRLDKDGHLVGLTLNKSETLTADDYRRLGELTGLRQLTFYGTCKMTDADAGQIGMLVTLEELAVNGTALSDAGFAHLGKLANLRKLIFWHLGWQRVEVTGKGFAELARCPKLETFGFAGSTVGDEGLKALTAVKSLRRLECYHTRITDAGLAYLKELPGLRAVTVGPQFSMRLGDAGLATLCQVPTLERIEYNETMLTYDGGLGRLRSVKGLKAVKLDQVEVSAADLEKLRADLPGVAIDHTPPAPKMLEQMRKIVANGSKK
jgi:hypothetical protein